jgi:hypothetical protein
LCISRGNRVSSLNVGEANSLTRRRGNGYCASVSCYACNVVAAIWCYSESLAVAIVDGGSSRTDVAVSSLSHSDSVRVNRESRSDRVGSLDAAESVR